MRYSFVFLWISLLGIQSIQAQKRLFQRGLAEMIEDSQNTGKLLALHRTLPPGKMIQLRNPVNSETVNVKIVGKLPNTGVNEKVIIKISQEAYTSLMASGRRFAVEIRNVPPPPKDIIHEVEKGDTLYGIAKKYNVVVEDLMEWNELEDTILSLGQELKIIRGKDNKK